MRERNGWEMNVPDSQFAINSMAENGETSGRRSVIISAPNLICGDVMISFQVIGLPFERFRSLFHLSDSAVAERNMRRVIATSKPVVFV
jgi:hypothetical protein